MTYRVEINDCLSQFHRAHQALIERLGGFHHFARQTHLSHWVIMERKWREEYRIIPYGEDGCWRCLDFPTKAHYTAFMIKWSQ